MIKGSQNTVSAAVLDRRKSAVELLKEVKRHIDNGIIEANKVGIRSIEKEISRVSNSQAIWTFGEIIKLSPNVCIKIGYGKLEDQFKILNELYDADKKHTVKPLRHIKSTYGFASCYAMEYVDGWTLKELGGIHDKVYANMMIPSILRQLSQAVSNYSKAQTYHRDLSPTNIIVKRNVSEVELKIFNPDLNINFGKERKKCANTGMEWDRAYLEAYRGILKEKKMPYDLDRLILDFVLDTVHDDRPKSCGNCNTL